MFTYEVRRRKTILQIEILCVDFNNVEQRESWKRENVVVEGRIQVGKSVT